MSTLFNNNSNSLAIELKTATSGGLLTEIGNNLQIITSLSTSNKVKEFLLDNFEATSVTNFKL